MSLLIFSLSDSVGHRSRVEGSCLMSTIFLGWLSEKLDLIDILSLRDMIECDFSAWSPRF